MTTHEDTDTQERAEVPKSLKKRAAKGTSTYIERNGFVRPGESTFPRPKYLQCRDTAHTKNAYKIFEYWEKLKPQQADIASLKVYRLWPICDLRIVDPKAKLEWDAIEGKIPFASGEYEQAFLERYGSGEWKVVLNEMGVSGKIMEAFFSAINTTEYPPKLDYRTLIRGAFRNQDYIQWLERQGIPLPWTTPQEEKATQEEEDEANMAATASEAVGQAMGTMATVVKDLAEARAKDKNGSDNIESLANKNVVEFMAGAANTMVASMAKNFDAVIEHTAKGHDPYEGMTRAVELVDKLRNGNSDTTKILELMQEQQREHNEILKSLLSRQTEDGVAVSPNAPKSFMDQLKEIKDTQDVLKELFGRPSRSNGNGETPAAPKSFWSTAFEAFMANPAPFTMLANGVLGQVAGIVSNFKAPAAVQPPQPNGDSNGHPQQQQVSAASNAQPQSAPQQEPWEVFFTRQLVPAFQAHFAKFSPDNPNSDTSGYTLAEYIISDGYMAGETQAGRAAYERMKEKLGPIMGEDGKPKGFPLASILAQLVPQVWAEWMGTPKKLDNFFEQMFTYDQYVAGLESEPQPRKRERPAKTVSIATPTAPVV